MKYPLSWLKAHAPLEKDVQALADDLVRLGHEVEAVETPRAALAGVVVGEILEKCKHPGADRLSLLKVDVGEDAPLSIVCGATNMQAGDKVPVARIGARLPNGMVIKKGRIRGETSFGMCCSEAELGLAEDAAGLMILPEDAPVGMAVGEYLALEEAVFDIAITPNRGDCMSIRGLARELAADAGLPLALPDAAPCARDAALPAPVVTVEAAADCPLYLACRIEGVRVAEAPEWIRRQLLAAGQRPVNGVVDVLNWLMLDIGQPMHAFDADRLRGGLRVRGAVASERFTALDGREMTLNEGDLVIADDAGVAALAGIIGAERTGVNEDTVNLVLESALFEPARISRTRRVHAMVSEASMRFERGVDPAMAAVAMERASRMIVELFGGAAGPVARIGSEADYARETTIACPVARIEARLGTVLREETDAVLRRMGFEIERADGELRAVAPAFRRDVAIPEDVSEEYARIQGYDAIPDVAATPVGMGRALPEAAVHAAIAGGCDQVIGYAFISAEEQRLFTPDDGRDLRLANPISEGMAVMRRSLWPGLLQAARHNMNRQQAGVALVEEGRIYEADGEGSREREVLAWLMTGRAEADAWHASDRLADFYDLKGCIEGWLARRRLNARFIADDALAGLQPGQSARILVGRSEVGRIGRVVREIAARYDLDAPVFVGEIWLDALPKGRAPKFAPLPEHPFSQRDLALLFDRSVSAEQIVQTARKAGGALVQDVRVFDRYAGKGIPEGRVSIGLRLTIGAPDRTLAQEEVDAAAGDVAAALVSRLGGELRG
ncbi:MAG: phenylalanine--tRNA ligase subunit beta [Mariprofundaceae bacterium]